MLPGFRIVGVDESPNAVLAARRPDDDLSVNRHGCRRQAVIYFVVPEGHTPANGAGYPIQRDQMTINRANVDHVVKHGDSPTCRMIAVYLDYPWQRRRPTPDRQSCAGVESRHCAGRLDDVHDSVDYDRRVFDHLAWPTALVDPSGP